MQLPNNTSIAVNKILFKYLLFFIILPPIISNIHPMSNNSDYKRNAASLIRPSDRGQPWPLVPYDY